MRNRFIYIIFILLTNLVLAKDADSYIKKITRNDTYKKIKDIVIEVKEATDKYQNEKLDSDIEAQNDICVECDDIIILTKNINRIIKEIGKDEPTSHLMLEHGNLEALTVVTEVVNKMTGTIVCEKLPTPNLTDDFTNIKDEELELQFESSSDLDYFFAQYRYSNNKKIIWLRGTGLDQRKVIKVILYPNGKSQLSYYLLPIESYDEKLETHKVSSNNDLPNINTRSNRNNRFKSYSQGKVDLSTNFEISSTDDTYVKINIGPSFDYEYFIPKGIKILNVSSKAQLTENYNLSGDIEVSEKAQKAKLNLMNNRGKKLLSAEIEKDDIKLGAAGQLDISDDFSIDSIATYSLDGSYSINTSVNHLQDNIVDTRLTRAKNGYETISISKEIVDHQKGTFSFKLEQSSKKGSQTRNQVWLTYSKKF